jgi:hypothetical protein
LNKSYSDAYTQVLSATNALFSNPQSNYPQFGIAGTVQTNSQAVSQANNDRVELNSLFVDWQIKVSSVNDSNIDSVTSVSLNNLQKVSSYLSNIINILNTYTQTTISGNVTPATFFTQES